jgi:hypothetical protein
MLPEEPNLQEKLQLAPKTAPDRTAAQRNAGARLPAAPPGRAARGKNAPPGIRWMLPML